jgi:hypothetical protein
MTEVWKMPIPSGQKMVLLALCDNANDQGECYPSVSMLTEKCSMSQRSIFSHIDWLEKHGIVSRENRSGRSTIYHIDPCKFCTPANSAPLQILHPTPATAAPPPLQNLHTTPANSAPITITEPSIESSRESSSAFRLKLQPEMRILEGVNRQIATDFIALRKAKKSPLTETAVNGIRREAEKLGYTLERALTVCCERGWAGFKADWILRDEAGRGAQSRTQNKQVALEESNRAATAGWVPPEMRGMQHAN